MLYNLFWYSLGCMLFSIGNVFGSRHLRQDWKLSNTSVWLASTAYCPPDTYLTREYKGESIGFVPTHHISVKEDTTEGIVGYMPRMKTIFVSFRGSETVENWLDDISVGYTDYLGCNECEVHKGFYSAQQAALPQVIDAIDSLRHWMPNFGIVVTGHSLGAALATLTAVDLILKYGNIVKAVHFGSPRVGNNEFAIWASTLFGENNHFRHTHKRDIAVHYPLHQRYMHLKGEVYEDPDLTFTLCDGYESTSCSYQWSITSIEDHMLYFGKELGIAGCV
jgi:hypothetical protein